MRAPVGPIFSHTGIADGQQGRKSEGHISKRICLGIAGGEVMPELVANFFFRHHRSLCSSPAAEVTADGTKRALGHTRMTGRTIHLSKDAARAPELDTSNFTPLRFI